MPTRVRSLLLSDIHLGTRGCKAEQLLEFLREHEADYTFMIGGIIDFWAMHRSFHWTSAQNTVVQKLLCRVRHGERIFLNPGNHDEALRQFDDTNFGNIQVVREYIHTAADGRRYLVIHTARERGMDGVICGHIHSATIRDAGEITYINCGDWVDSCTPIVEHHAVNLSAGSSKDGDWHVQNVNAYHGRLKAWVQKFRGVATSYLANYLGWFAPSNVNPSMACL